MRRDLMGEWLAAVAQGKVALANAIDVEIRREESAIEERWAGYLARDLQVRRPEPCAKRRRGA